jgi:hypothetical protein
MRNQFLDLHQIVKLVENSNRDSIIDAYVQNAERIAKTPGARKKHQAWEGGYLDHVVYATNFGVRLHNLNLDLGFQPDHSEGDIALVMLLHDFGKIARYRKVENGWDYVENPDQTEKNFFRSAIDGHGFQLTDIQKNALEFVHGEGSKYTPKGRLMLPLATLCHQADVWNARYCSDNPLPNGQDPWQGAYRHSEKTDLVGYIRALFQFKSC